MQYKNPLAVLLSPRGKEKYSDMNVKEFLHSYSSDHTNLTDHDRDKINAVKESITQYVHIPKLTNSMASTESAKRFFNTILQHKEQEEVVIALLNTRNYVIHYETVFKGSLNTSVFHPREIAKVILRHPTARFMVAHNHPSGDPQPSQADISSTRRIKEVGELIGVDLLDHIIVGTPDCLSMREEGFI